MTFAALPDAGLTADESHISAGAEAKYPPDRVPPATRAPSLSAASRTLRALTPRVRRARAGFCAAAASCTTSVCEKPPDSSDVAVRTRSTPGSTLR